MYLWSLSDLGSALAVGLIDGRTAVGLILLGALVLFLVTALPRARPMARVDDEGPPGGTPSDQGVTAAHDPS